MMTPRVSVLMTVHNGGPFLAAAVDSVLAQTWTDFECLIRDDGSTDDTPAQLRAYAARDPRVQVWVAQPRLGLVRSMNQLFPRARGQFVTRHDADDVSRPQRFARQVAFLEAHPAVGVVGTPVEVIDAAGRPVPHTPYFSQHTDNDQIQADLLLGCCYCQGSVMLRRACLEQVGYYDQALEQAEDYDLWLRLAEVTKLANLATPLYCYRRHDQAISSRRAVEQALNSARVIEKAVGRRYGPTPPLEQRLLVARRYVQCALLGYALGDPNTANSCVAQARQLAPELLHTPAALMEEALDFAPRHSTAASLRAANLLLDQLPELRGRERVRHRVLGRLHMREVFAGAREGDPVRVDEHVWAGVRHDPAWLLNRGVRALLARAAVRRLRQRPTPARRGG
jgi:GT2 family glycosyltransferase